MIDFWEIAGRLLLMDPVTRNRDLYDANTGILPIQAGGCILAGHCNTPTLPFPIQSFYDRLRDYLSRRYAGADKLFSPAISMFALGESGVMFFNQPFRDLFESLSHYLLTGSAARGRTDTGSASLFYIVLGVLALDTKSRKSVAGGDFLGLAPEAMGDRDALMQLAGDQEFNRRANEFCFTGGWTNGSANTLRDQTYGIITHTIEAEGQDVLRIDAKTIPFRHIRFVASLP